LQKSNTGQLPHGASDHPNATRSWRTARYTYAPRKTLSSKGAKGEGERAWVLFLDCEDMVDFREFEVGRVGFELLSEGEESDDYNGFLRLRHVR